MIAIKEIMVKNVITIDKNKSTYDACKLMTDHSVSCIVVTEKERPVGLVTERTILQRVILNNKSAEKTKVKDAMHEMLTMKPDDDFFSLVEYMRKNHARRIVIVDKGKIAGIITETDVVRASYTLKQELESSKDKNKDGFIKKLESIQKGLRKIDSGYKDFNDILKGGIPIGKSILLVGEPGSGKGLIAFNFMKNGLINNGKVIYICMNELVRDIKELFVALDVNIDKYIVKGDFKIINMYEDVIDGSQKIYNEEEQLLVREFGIIKQNVLEAVKDASLPVRCVINVISQSLVMHDPKRVYKFTLMINNLMKENGITTIYFMHELPDKKDDQNLVTMEEIMDGVIELGIDEKNSKAKKKITIRKMKPEFAVLPQFYSYDFNKERELSIKRIEK